MADDKTKLLEEKRDRIRKTSENIKKILLSFDVLLKNLRDLIDQKKDNKKAQLSTLEGGFFSRTKKKLIDLKAEFDDLDSDDGPMKYMYFKELPTALHASCRQIWNEWQKDKKDARVLKSKLLATLSVPEGKFYKGIEEGKVVTREDIASLKKDVAALLSLTRF